MDENQDDLDEVNDMEIGSEDENNDEEGENEENDEDNDDEDDEDDDDEDNINVSSICKRVEATRNAAFCAMMGDSDDDDDEDDEDDDNEVQKNIIDRLAWPAQPTDKTTRINLPLLIRSRLPNKLLTQNEIDAGTSVRCVLLGIVYDEAGEKPSRSYVALMTGGVVHMGLTNVDEDWNFAPWSSMSAAGEFIYRRSANGWNHFTVDDVDSPFHGQSVGNIRRSHGGPGFNNTLADELLEEWGESKPTTLKAHASYWYNLCCPQNNNVTVGKGKKVRVTDDDDDDEQGSSDNDDDEQESSDNDDDEPDSGDDDDEQEYLASPIDPVKEWTREHKRKRFLKKRVLSKKRSVSGKEPKFKKQVSVKIGSPDGEMLIVGDE